MNEEPQRDLDAERLEATPEEVAAAGELTALTEDLGLYER